MKKIAQIFSNPTVRLAARAIVAAAIVAVTQIHAASGGTVAWRSLAVGCGLAFCEIFTPLNALVGVFKAASPPAAPTT
jgi:hypothetical protein